MTLAEEQSDLALRLGKLVHRVERELDVAHVVGELGGLQHAPHGGVGREHGVVLVLSEAAHALHAHHALHLEGHVADADRASHGVVVGEEIVRDRAADQAHARALLLLHLVEEVSRHNVPVADSAELGGAAIDGGVPVLLGVNHLHLRAHLRRHGLNEVRKLAADGVAVRSR